MSPKSVPVSVVAEIAVLQEQMKVVMEEVKELKADSLANAKLKVYAAGYAAAIVTACLVINWAASSSVVAAVEQVVRAKGQPAVIGPVKQP